MISSEDTSITTEQLKPLDDVLRDWEVGAMDAAGTIEDLVALIESLSSPSDETLRGALEEIYEVRQKLVALRRMVEAAGQPFYEEILNEVIPVLARAHDAALTRTAEPMLTPEEEDELVERINANPNLHPAEPTDELLRRLVRQYVDPFDVAPEDHALVLAIGTDDEEGYRAALSAALQGEMQPSEPMRDAIVKAYTEGATEVHYAWVNSLGEENTPSHEADFGEAAHDYADEAIAAMRAAALRGDGPVAKEGKQR